MQQGTGLPACWGSCVLGKPGRCQHTPLECLLGCTCPTCSPRSPRSHCHYGSSCVAWALGQPLGPFIGASHALPTISVLAQTW